MTKPKPAAIQVRNGKVLRCPLCGRPRDEAFRPFCSARCRDVDLAKWLDGSYAVAAVESGDDNDGEA
ncbi:MAG: DNA gyrase inhibitor YacG [Geminicoccaceae bacterium]|nr:DNA gyrase inhibitor YacG [Geminicoccaceae bacterium]